MGLRYPDTKRKHILTFQTLGWTQLINNKHFHWNQMTKIIEIFSATNSNQAQIYVAQTISVSEQFWVLLCLLRCPFSAWRHSANNLNQHFHRTNCWHESSLDIFILLNNWKFKLDLNQQTYKEKFDLTFPVV